VSHASAPDTAIEEGNMSTVIWKHGRILSSVAFLAVFLSACGPAKEKSAPEKPAGSPSPSAEAGGPVMEGETEVDPELLAEGKKAWRGCATCHCATDPAITEDEDWVVMNEVTTCIEAGKPAPRLRESIIVFLRHPDTLRPVLVDDGFEPGEGGEAGKVLVPPSGGSAYLKAERDSVKAGSPSMVRLYWKQTPEEKAVKAPVGEYNVINYWLYRKGGENGGERWMVTGTNVDGCTQLSIGPDFESSLNLDCMLYGEFGATMKDGAYTLSFSLSDLGGNRLSLSKNGRLVMPRYRILDEKGETVAEETFQVI
jgi:hypothetical protein